jgi:cytochrome c-type biogenesis protein
MLADIVETGLASWWAPALAFAAGVVSVTSPCVWPLLPGYVSFISGGTAEAEGDRAPLLPILLFIGGFTVVFTVLGAFASTFARIFQGTGGQRVAGTVVIVLGVLMIGYALGRGSIALYAERRPFLERVNPGTIGAFPLGMAFAAGWSPCIGPVLGGILTMAAAGSKARGTYLMVAYSLGLGLPFLLVGLGLTRFTSVFAWMKRHYRPIAIVSGGFLVFVGVLLFTGAFTRFFAPLARRFTPGL